MKTGQGFYLSPYFVILKFYYFVTYFEDLFCSFNFCLYFVRYQFCGNLHKFGWVIQSPFHELIILQHRIKNLLNSFLYRLFNDTWLTIFTTLGATSFFCSWAAAVYVWLVFKKFFGISVCVLHVF